MATLTYSYKPSLAHIVFVKTGGKLFEIYKPRRCMLVSMGSILAGLGIPLLMTLELLPVTLLLGFVGLALTATGSLLVLVYCGEI